MNCSEGGTSCVGIGKDAQCVSCQDVTPDNDFEIKPSSGLCSSLVEPDVPNKQNPGNLDEKNYCFYTQDPSMIISGFTTALYVTTPGMVISPISVILSKVGITEHVDDIIAGTCAELKIDCKSIKTCEAYDKLEAANETTDDELEDLEPDAVGAGEVNIKTVCESDPCGVAKKVDSIDRCVYDTGGLFPVRYDDCKSVKK